MNEWMDGWMSERAGWIDEQKTRDIVATQAVSYKKKK
jgi:hypothetical protein